jgi:transketolase
VIYDENHRFELGRSDVLREGGDVTLAGIGLMVHHCLQAADLLAQEGVSARVINLSCLKPLDWQLVVDSARLTGALVTAEEHLATGGLGSAVSEVLAAHFPVPLQRIGLQDIFGTSGQADILLQHYGLMPEDIKRAALKALAHKNGR